MKKFLIFGVAIFLISTSAVAGLFDRKCDSKVPSDKWDQCVGRSSYFSSIYDGHWVDGKPDGDGVIEYSQTEAFEGTFKNGKAIFNCQGISSLRKYKDSIKSEASPKLIKFLTPPFEKNTLRKLVSGEMDGAVIAVDLISLSLMEEFVGPSIKKSTYREYETNVGGLVVGGVLTLGIYPLLNPKESARNLAGCTELRGISFEPEKEKSKPTGIKLVEKKANERFFENISFSYQEFKREVPLAFSWVKDRYRATINIDKFPELQKLLEENIQSPELKLTVGCNSCRTEADIEQSKWTLPTDFTQLAPNIEIGTMVINTALFNSRVAKEELLAREEKVRRDEEEKLRRERERIAKEGDGSADDLACKKKNLKPSTPPYLKCRQQVINERETQAALEEKKKRQKEEADKNSAGLNIEKISIDIAKKKCIELGFKSASEGYGKCVLQLSR
jgi:hypothetical protein